jgi:hypothetical protein
MKNLLRFTVACLLFAPICVSPLHAQTASDVANSTAAPAGQAPDDMARKITDLVHSGKYADAQKLVAGLLIAYPDDQRLIKAKALIEKMLAPGGSAGATPASQRTEPAADANAEQLTGMDKVDYNALIALAKQAQQTTDLDEQKKLLQQFMDQSAPFLQRHPDLTLLWQFRVISAISLNEPVLGYEAGQKLLAGGAADSSDPVLQNLLAQLRNTRWLDRQGMEDAEEYRRLQNLGLGLVYGEWTKGFHWFFHAVLTLTVSGLGDLKEPVNIRLENASPKTCRLDGGAVGMITIKPGDATNGTYTTSRTAMLTSKSNFFVPCTVNAYVVNKAGKTISSVNIVNGW